MLRHDRVLVLAAHPDDEVLGVGGTIPRLVNRGAYVAVAIASDGSSTQYPGDANLHKQKWKALDNAREILGFHEVIELGYPDMQLDTVPHAELNSAITGVLLEGQFDTVFVHHPHDLNRDHQVLYQSLLVAARPVPRSPIQSILTYHVNSSTEWGGRSHTTVFCPNVYIDITSTIDRKLQALESYDLELRPHPHPRSINAVRDRASVFGTEVGLQYAEAFSLILARATL